MGKNKCNCVVFLIEVEIGLCFEVPNFDKCNIVPKLVNFVDFTVEVSSNCNSV